MLNKRAVQFFFIALVVFFLFACGIFLSDNNQNDVIAAESGAVCGNGIMEIGEQCEDSNTNDNDGCANCLFALPHTGTIYYVDKDAVGGNSCSDTGSGLINEPFCTLEPGLQAVQAGEAVVVRAGIYDEAVASVYCDVSYTASPSALSPVNLGTENNPITIMGYPGEFPVVTFGDPTKYGCRVLGAEDTSYVTIQGFYIDYARLRCGNSDHVIFRGNIVDGRDLSQYGDADSGNGGGIFLQNCVHSLVQSNEIFGVVGVGNNEGCIQVYDMDPSYPRWSGTSSNIYENNYLHDCDDYGIYLKQSPYDDIIRRNWVENIRDRSIHAGGQLDSVNIEIYENVAIGGGRGITVFTSNGRTDTTLIHNNLVINNNVGITTGAVVYDTQLWNNIVMNPSNNALLYNYDAPIFSYSNYNLFYNYPNLAQRNYNVDSATLSIWQTTHNLDSNSIEAQPIFSDSVYHLDEVSPGKGVGKNGEDLGAYPRNDATLIGAPDFLYTAPATPACVESWSCESWTTCTDNQQTRICTDQNNCGSTQNRPTLSQSCLSEPESCTELWTCGSWSTCANDTQTRTCTDSNTCGTTAERPVLSQSCQSEPTPEPTPEPQTSPGGGGTNQPAPNDNIVTPQQEQVQSGQSKLIKTPESSAVYLLRNNQLQVFFNHKSFLANGYKWEDIVEVSKNELTQYIMIGTVSFPDGAIIKGDSPQVYIIHNQTRRWIKDETVFNSLGLKWQNLVVMSWVELGNFQSGLDITSAESSITTLLDTIDTDKDDLADYQERIYGTDVNKSDTDGDGFNDALEILKGYDPLKK